jgi:hypothetical protein
MAEADSPLLSDLRSLREKALSLQGRRGLNEETTKAALIVSLLALTALGVGHVGPGAGRVRVSSAAEGPAIVGHAVGGGASVASTPPIII